MARTPTVLAIAALVIAVSAGCSPPTTPTPTTVAPTLLQLGALSTSAGRVSVGQSVNVRLAKPAGAVGNWVLERSALPAGMSFDVVTGTVHGTPTQAGAWYVRVHLQLTGGSGADLLPFYEVLGGVTETLGTTPAPPPGTFHAHTVPRVIGLTENYTYNLWVAQADGTLRQPASLPAFGSVRVGAEEFEYQSQDYFPFATGYQCDHLKLRMPGSTLWSNPVDEYTIPAAEAGTSCITRSSKNHRHFAVAEQTSTGAIRMHMLGPDAQTQEWVTDLPTLSATPNSMWSVADDGTTVAFVHDYQAVVVSAAGVSVVDLPYDLADAWCGILGDAEGRATAVTHLPLKCTHATGERSVGYVDLTDGSSTMSMLPPALNDSYVTDDFVGGWTFAEKTLYDEFWNYAGEQLWAVEVGTGSAQMIHDYTGSTDPHLDFTLLGPA